MERSPNDNTSKKPELIFEKDSSGLQIEILNEIKRGVQAELKTEIESKIESEIESEIESNTESNTESKIENDSKHEIRNETKPYRFRKHKSEPCEKFVIRFPKGMRARVHLIANKNRRSMNKEIIARLEYSFLIPSPSPLMVEIQSAMAAKHAVTVPAESGSHLPSPNASVDLLLNQKIQKRLAALTDEQKRDLLTLLSH